MKAHLWRASSLRQGSAFDAFIVPAGRGVATAKARRRDCALRAPAPMLDFHNYVSNRLQLYMPKLEFLLEIPQSGALGSDTM